MILSYCYKSYLGILGHTVTMRIILARLKSREPNLARNWLKVLFVTLLDILADVLLVTLEPVKLWCKDLKVQKERPEFMGKMDNK